MRAKIIIKVDCHSMLNKIEIHQVETITKIIPSNFEAIKENLSFHNNKTTAIPGRINNSVPSSRIKFMVV